MGRLFGLLVLVVGMLPNTSIGQEHYRELVVIGDSLSETGNSFAATGIPPSGPNGFPYFEGRFSNGPIWIDFLQSALSIADEGVLNFAVGGASTGFGLKEPPSGIFEAPAGLQVPTLGAQIELYLQVDTPRVGQLFIVWGGANDLLTLESPFVTARNMENHIRSLAAAGATDFLVPNLAPLGETPLAENAFQRWILNLFTLSYNYQLKLRLARLERQLPISIEVLDTFSLTLQALEGPFLFGFTNTTSAALSDIVAGVITPTEGANYLFWDPIHPTSLTHSIIAQAALAMIRS